MSFRTSSQAKAAAHLSWSKTFDRTARTEKAREAMLANLEKVVDPDGRMSPRDRRKAAMNAHKARLLNASQKAADQRIARREAREKAEQQQRGDAHE
jgi:hypothetical protein